ncbi:MULTISPECIES: methionine ABC transporter substrate-binding lipoprotein MetQ [Olivibacter]|uniref:Lipoprotein n=3 Tax=Sphingobacteriaceae TaxID=84566 RepID=F4C692_SPHS2|nr:MULTISPECIES: methionine ABC transporter substrate-binding lipoprotein MetQ [Olivibacter]MDM8173346.1 methionine ABC transporter substrate-binding lipoprotein MetQ [Olivibacter sp. 47]MDX3915217.1 methionine ABC transporter substrate-binding lipoprotein MetQ [Pseudosphingobacterium sp.]QEL03121.1 MetQ/NlpA family lipoprotein [Olivibacter sp. LS-1]
MKNFSLLGIILLIVFASCGNASKNNPNHIKVGVEAGPEYSLAEAAQRVAKEKYGLEVELVQFNDYVMPNEALRQNDIDVNVFQNKPYLDVQAKQRGYDFAILGNTFVFPLAGYSKKIKNIDQLQVGNTIIIPNDPTNGGRALLLMEKVGLIKLKDGVGLLPTVNDIVENPKSLRILELEAPQLPRSLDDAQVTVAIINNTFAASIGLVAKKDGIFVEDEKSPYVNIIVSRTDNQHEEKVKKFVEAYQSPEVEAVAEKVFKGGAIKGW